jgi:hypothetical protein
MDEKGASVAVQSKMARKSRHPYGIFDHNARSQSLVFVHTDKSARRRICIIGAVISGRERNRAVCAVPASTPSPDQADVFLLDYPDPPPIPPRALIRSHSLFS